jgi:hypothetical protein
MHAQMPVDIRGRIAAVHICSLCGAAVFPDFRGIDLIERHERFHEGLQATASDARQAHMLTRPIG